MESGCVTARAPPLMASADAKPTGDWTIVARDDGKMMWAYRGQTALHLEKRQRAR